MGAASRIMRTATFLKWPPPRPPSPLPPPQKTCFSHVAPLGTLTLPPPTHTCYSHVARLGTPSSWIEVLSSAESTGGNYFDFLEYAAVGARGFYLQYPGSPPEHIHATQVGSGVGVSHDARGGG